MIQQEATEIKHSKPPWTLVEGDENGDIYVKLDTNHELLIGNMEGSCGKCHANARLIVAAPDLLDALQALYEVYDSNTDFVAVMDQVRAAIIKATEVPL